MIKTKINIRKYQIEPSKGNYQVLIEENQKHELDLKTSEGVDKSNCRTKCKNVYFIR